MDNLEVSRHWSEVRSVLKMGRGSKEQKSYLASVASIRNEASRQRIQEHLDLVDGIAALATKGEREAAFKKAAVRMSETERPELSASIILHYKLLREARDPRLASPRSDHSRRKEGGGVFSMLDDVQGKAAETASCD